MEYPEWSYLYPPRPEKAVSPAMLDMYEDMGWVAQAKLNGTCNVMGVSPANDIKAMNRHAEPHKSWEPSPHTAVPFENLPRTNGGWYVFVSELLHSKVSGIRDFNYIHDILVADGVQLVGMTFSARQELLRGLFTPVSEAVECHVLDEHTLLAANHTRGLRGVYERIKASPVTEGLVLKNPKSTLAPCWKASANTGWQVKTRYPHKNYSF